CSKISSASSGRITTIPSPSPARISPGRITCPPTTTAP
ncbi:hypothetical protein PBMFNG_PBMFNG_14255, partial [Dysosmobacter welbionis]